MSDTDVAPGTRASPQRVADMAPVVQSPSPPVAADDDGTLVQVRAFRWSVVQSPSYRSAAAWRDAWSGDLAHWRSSPDARRALAEFDALGGSEHDRMFTLGRIAGACVSAMQYDPAADPGVLWRANMAYQRSEAFKLEAAARVLALSCERGDRAMFWLPGTPPEAAQAMPNNATRSEATVHQWAAAFRAIERQAAGRVPELHGRSWWLAHTLGNLHYPQPIKPGRRVDVATMLAFELTLYLRLHTAGRAREIVSSGQRMPGDTVGWPRHALVASFVNATLQGVNLDRLRVRDRLSEMPQGVGLIEWP